MASLTGGGNKGTKPKPAPGISVAEVIAVRPRGASVTSVTSVVAAGGTHRQCTITISNHSSHSLINPRMHVSSGSCTTSLPDKIVSSMEATVEFKKTPHTATGAVGVFTYELQEPGSESHTKILAVMFSVPYDYIQHSNWHAAGFLEKNKTCDQDLFNEMYYNSLNGFARQKAGSLISHSDGDFTVRASMTDTYTPVMTVEISSASSAPTP